jgi:hypothetical protein
LLKRISTGKVRPGMVKVGTLPKNIENLLESIVAEVTISLRSCLRATICQQVKKMQNPVTEVVKLL